MSGRDRPGRLGLPRPTAFWGAALPTILPAALLTGLLALLLAATPAWASGEVGLSPQAQRALVARLDALIEHGGVAVAENGRAVFRYHPGLYVPASVLKLATALAAFGRLGPQHRFVTEVYAAEGALYVKGLGDPYFVSEEWARLSADLARDGALARPYRALVLDDSALAGPLRFDGLANSLNPYDAPLGALVSNFNTVFVEVEPGGRVRSAEPQTPLTPIAERLGRSLTPGQHRINLAARGVEGLDYSGELGLAFLREAGGTVSGPARRGRVPQGALKLREHRSERTLREVVTGMLKYSNNYIANQLVLALALQAHGEPATLEQGMVLLREHLQAEIGLKPEQFTLIEGSGLSRRDRIALDALLAVTAAYYPWRDTLSPHEGGGSASSGNPGDRAVLAKTGTLRGVYSLVGFLPAPDGTQRSFVIVLNQRRNTRDAVLRELLRAFPPP